MRAWLVRGVSMAVVHAVVLTAVADVRVTHPDWTAWARPLSLAVLAVLAMLWGGLDTWQGRTGHGMVWFRAALLAGPTAGVLGLVGQGLLVDKTGVEALGAAVTGGAAFTALLVLVPAFAGLALARITSHPAAAEQRQV
ncbi:MAG: B-4DMT family transporter [Kutzneria sp.]|nr:B-4DMT family transporter [Kutzneria sp.]MBV9847640.1 B-4DMT family transporter [Kutzneria sp.]